MALKSLLEHLSAGFKDEIAHYRYIEPRSAEYAEPETPVNDSLIIALKNKGVNKFFTHQTEGIDLIRKGHNIIVMTPTASGKSLIYNIPVLESILNDPSSKSLYLFPLKGLEQDQFKILREIAQDLDIAHPAEIYDGDTTAYRRKKIRGSFPNIIFSNPDMLHLAINAFHTKWAEFFKNLKFVVIDEIHTYRGVFGSHVAQVLRRLRRICRYYGSNPQFIACSATIANPGELAGNLTGLDFEVIDHSGAPSGGRHIVFLNPWGSPYTASTKAFKLCLDEGLKSIAFTKSRKITELMYSWLIDASPENEGLVSSYRAGFLPAERREIEQRLFSGELNGVISTSALELGVDIGGLDACILAGYPGSIASTWQRAGRTGRQRQDAVIILVGLKDALDQYFMRHPDDFFARNHEAVVIDASNAAILKQHIPCASAEIYLRAGDFVYDTQALAPVITELETSGLLKQGKTGDIWFSQQRYPQREVSIRGIGKIFNIFSGGRRIGEISGARIFKEAHPGAVYLHKGRQYIVQELDLENFTIHCKEADISYYTQAITSEETEIIKEVLKKDNINWGELRTTHRVTGYWRKKLLTQEKIDRYPVELPSWTFNTQGLWVILGSNLKQIVEKNNLNFAGGLHAFEHAAISALPLFAMCDKGDIGGISYPLYPQLLAPAIFIYDGYEGGIGLTKRGLEVIGEWLEAAKKIITDCPCEDGCPSCVQDPQCGSGNDPLDKRAAILILEEIKAYVPEKL
ncbi:MAG: DEAD/DEAH box helicase [Nitrospirae bacterium]|nr:DEAD/DEAH box helicase [Nitrospirota bacterium]